VAAAHAAHSPFRAGHAAAQRQQLTLHGRAARPLAARSGTSLG
jgi:hypothetical protein